jgi:hypothetical protein
MPPVSAGEDGNDSRVTIQQTVDGDEERYRSAFRRLGPIEGSCQGEFTK